MLESPPLNIKPPLPPILRTPNILQYTIMGAYLMLGGRGGSILGGGP